MPCAEGELCLVQASSPEGRDGHGCQGTCGGRLHDTCGSVVGDNEMHRICSKCLDKKGKRKKGSPEGPGSGQSTSKRSKTTGGSEGASRARLTIKQKMEVVRLLDKRISHEEIADHFGCATRTVRKIKAEREKVQKEAAIAGRDDMRTARQGEFPQVGYTTSTAVLHRLRPCSPLFLQIVLFRAHYLL